MTEQEFQADSSTATREPMAQEVRSKLFQRIGEDLIKAFWEGDPKIMESDGGAYSPEPEYPGQYIVQTRTAYGPRTFRKAILGDAQSATGDWYSDDLGPDDVSGPAARPTTLSNPDPWARVTDDSLGTQDRIDALYECMSSEQDKVARYVLDTLGEADINERWRDAVVFATEDLQLTNAKLRSGLEEDLLGVAKRLMSSTRAADERVVWSALRTATSLMPTDEVKRLGSFLGPPSPVDTRLVALRCVTRIFEPAPPQPKDYPQELANRIAELADKFLDPDLLIPGEHAAIAIHAVTALVALCDPRAEAAVQQVVQLKCDWVARLIRQELQRLLSSWETSEADGVSQRPADHVGKLLGELQVCAGG